MANLRRRSARLSKVSTNPPSTRKTPLSAVQLGSLVERDETPDTIPQSIDGVLATPSTSRTVDQRFAELNALTTPRTEPRPAHNEMNPKTVHRSTAKAPDSGLKLGFLDISAVKKNDTPSKSASRQSIPTASTFEFKFSSDSHLSQDAQRLMDNVREDAAKIKAQMLAEKAAQEQKDKDADKMFGAGRKIAQPKGKAGRFSDVHMAQFKKMDSIANHASAFRAKPTYAAPTAQSLKRSPSKAGLDEIDRPRVSGKRSQPQLRRDPPQVIGRPSSVSPFKSIPTAATRTAQGLNKRARSSVAQDVSESRPISAPPQPKSSTLLSPTKSSMARTSQGTASTNKPSMIPRSNSTISLKSDTASRSIGTSLKSPQKPSIAKPLPPVPTEEISPLYPELSSLPVKSPVLVGKESKFQSKLPTLAGLRSILRGNRKQPTAVERQGTPKRPNTVDQNSDAPKKVNFTPSVKSRHAVKLAADSPSPAKIRRDTPYKSSGPVIPYDSSAYVIEDNSEQDWEDEDSGVNYPTLPPSEVPESVGQDFSNKAKEHNRRESKDFKSIFTDLHPTRPAEPATLTSINTQLNQTDPETHANKVMKSPNNARTKPSPSTIRHVTSTANTEVRQPFGLNANNSSAKRRHDQSTHDDSKHDCDGESKENRSFMQTLSIPGGWNDADADETEDEGTSRGGKRVRVSNLTEIPVVEKKPTKKPNAAREAAAKNAKNRKSRGPLSLSRLNMLSRPKSRG